MYLIMAGVLYSFPCNSDSVSDIRAIMLDGKPFVAFDKVSAQKLLQMRIDFPKLQLTIKKQEDLLVVKSKEITTLEHILANLSEQKTILLDEHVRLQQQLTDVTAWYNNPYLWACVGIVFGTGTTILVVYATH